MWSASLNLSTHVCLLVFAPIYLISDVVFAENLSKQAKSILSQRCQACHGIEFHYNELDVLNEMSLFSNVTIGDEEIAYIKPGAPKASWIWQKIADDTMPQGTPLTDAEKAIIYNWILEGATWPSEETRYYVSELEALTSISQHLSKFEKSERRYQKYFSLVHIFNNQNISGRDLRIHRAALSKAVNSMSDQPLIVTPKPIDSHKTIYHIDLRDYGWEKFGIWQSVLVAYPYGLQPIESTELVRQYTAIRDLNEEVFFDGIPYVRADWFVARATQPPLYHTLAKIPQTSNELLETLNVDVEQHLRVNKCRRAGLVESGVSTQNRLIEYHNSKMGSLWITYDFSPEDTKSNLMRFPLGPNFAGHEFPELAFKHSGGEIIYELPNGLHGYMLVDAEGQRIDKAPVEIVSDPESISGSPRIVNGISCMHCHKHGMLSFSDSVRSGNALSNTEARSKIEEIYPMKMEMDDALKRSKTKYLQHLQATISDALEIDSSDFEELLKYEDPISRVSLLYRKNLNLETVARELTVEDKDWLKHRLENSQLIELGLGPLVNNNNTIKRHFWEKQDSAFSIFQEVAFELRIGVPVKN